MGSCLLEKAQEAFNNGDILPTGEQIESCRDINLGAESVYVVFVFPPRTPGQSGPMIWNHQLLAFAGVSSVMHPRECQPMADNPSTETTTARY